MKLFAQLCGARNGTPWRVANSLVIIFSVSQLAKFQGSSVKLTGYLWAEQRQVQLLSAKIKFEIKFKVWNQNFLPACQMVPSHAQFACVCVYMYACVGVPQIKQYGKSVS